MGRKRIDPIVEGQIRALLDIKWSERMIIQHLKKKKISVSKGVINRIKNREPKSSPVKENKRQKGVNFKKFNDRKMKKLGTMAKNPNPKTQTQIARALGVTQPVISYHINKSLNMKKKMKRLGHLLSPKNIENRRTRSWNLYRMLNNQKWRKIVTTDEAWFYVNNCNGKRRIHYVSRDNSKLSNIQEYYERKESNSKGFMVWAGISANGKTNLHFIEPGAKINSDYYINNVLKKFIVRDARRLYPNGDWILHQDSAPSHASKKTIQFLRSNNIKFITKEEWIPKSPDAAPMDYHVWGYLKRQLWKYKIKDTAGLKRALKREWKNIPQEQINKALEDWPRRVLNIYKNKGRHIE